MDAPVDRPRHWGRCAPKRRARARDASARATTTMATRYGAIDGREDDAATREESRCAREGARVLTPRATTTTTTTTGGGSGRRRAMQMVVAIVIVAVATWGGRARANATTRARLALETPRARDDGSGASVWATPRHASTIPRDELFAPLVMHQRVLEPWAKVVDAGEANASKAPLGGFFRRARNAVSNTVNAVSNTVNTVASGFDDVVVGSVTNFNANDPVSAFKSFQGSLETNRGSLDMRQMCSAVNLVSTHVSSASLNAFSRADGFIMDAYDETHGFTANAARTLEMQANVLMENVGDVIDMIEAFLNGLNCRISPNDLETFANKLLASAGSANIAELTKIGNAQDFGKAIDGALCMATWAAFFPSADAMLTVWNAFKSTLANKCPAIMSTNDSPAFTLGLVLSGGVASGVQTAGVGGEIGVGIDGDGRQFCYWAACAWRGVTLPSSEAGTAIGFAISVLKSMSAVPGQDSFLSLGVSVDLPPPLDFDLELGVSYIYGEPPGVGKPVGVSLMIGGGISGGISPPVNVELAQGVCIAHCTQKNGLPCDPSATLAALGGSSEADSTAVVATPGLGDYQSIMTDNEAKCYINRYADLRRAFGTNLNYAKEHYYKSGRHQRREFTCGQTLADWECYLARHPDLPWSEASYGESHFFEYGWHEGRTSYCKGKRDRYAYANPASGDSLNAYDAMCYALAYVDLKNLGWAHPNQYSTVNSHYWNHGRYEGRVPVCSMENVITEMDMRCYLNRYHDLRGYCGTSTLCATNHFRQWGRFEGRDGKCPHISAADMECYKKRYVPWSTNPREHWLQDGWSKGWSPTCAYDKHKHELINDEYALCYLYRYPDLLKVFGDNVHYAKWHWNGAGIHEGRKMLCNGKDEEAKCYISANWDVRLYFNSHGWTFDTVRWHMRAHGVWEGRGGYDCDFTNDDWRCYLDRYPDLRQAFGADITRAREHFFGAGFREGRNPRCA